MPQTFSFEETPDSRQSTREPAGFTLIYKAVGETDSYLVDLYAQSASPVTVFRPAGLLYRKDIRIDPDGHAQYLVTVPYGKLDKKNAPTGTATFSFSTSGATINIKAAKEHIKSYPDDGDWHKGSINVKGEGEVEGADIIVPALKLTYGFKHPEGVVNETFARTLAYATGHVNSDPFRGFAPGELLFGGASGSDGTEAEAEVSYDFIAQTNESDYSIGDITGIVKQGHHYAWAEFEDDVQDGEAIRPPKRVHIERLYNTISFSSTFGWS